MAVTTNSYTNPEQYSAKLTSISLLIPTITVGSPSTLVELTLLSSSFVFIPTIISPMVIAGTSIVSINLTQGTGTVSPTTGQLWPL